ncbi:MULTISPECIES: type II toxin-antitoxin system RelE/ParE family toxin [unclassified Rhizobium]|uniref:type II toxin-antitoxin system RelE/ParE family toxin n=1 Tax=unclassified Rhizobium TaxID=2613769 RepID=UPI000715691A|nr:MULTISPECIES: type II toxin-antitoxin system RelE/ParE family toxin [unclassified Rhizobium]KQS87674.1 plasmid stabilization protein [Rhizobium sp. Leaf391]KQT07110.1 plasmid stabilization protein [Rhizobium sp. Leaf386]KQT95236.1 plasmid stabilization protein [Rhizobium sp. Leaf453]
MSGYLFYPPADAAQDRIWADTVEQWGKAQAVTYMTGLHTHLQKLSETRSLWRKLPRDLVIPTDLRTEAFFSRYERHFLFFRELPSGKIGIMAILHDRMDIPVRLHEDLTSISDRLRDED